MMQFRSGFSFAFLSHLLWQSSESRLIPFGRRAARSAVLYLRHERPLHLLACSQAVVEDTDGRERNDYTFLLIFASFSLTKHA